MRFQVLEPTITPYHMQNQNDTLYTSKSVNNQYFEQVLLLCYNLYVSGWQLIMSSEHTNRLQKFILIH